MSDETGGAGSRGLAPGTVIAGKYTVERQLGEGGMGAVYLCEQAVVGRKVALKLLLPEYATNRDVVARFMREAGASSKIDHPNMVQIFDFGDHNGQPYLVMELLKGHDLTHEIEKVGPLSLSDIATLGIAVANALQVAHDAGFIHRDIKGDNIFISDNGTIKVLDFGIAKAVNDAKLTKTGGVVGTPATVSPEQARGRGDVDSRSDIYSLGCVLFACAAGEYPFIRQGTGDYLIAHIQDPARWLPDVAPWVPREFGFVVNKCLEKDPALRYQSMGELAAALQQFTSAVAAPPKRAAGDTRGVVQRSLQLTPVGLRRGSSPSMANGELTPPPMRAPSKSQRPIIIAVAAGVLILGGAAVFVATRKHSDVPVAAINAPPPPSTAPVAPPTASRVRVVTKPEGAVLTLDGKRIGVTPYVVEAAPRTTLALTLDLPGYETTTVRANVGDADSVVNVPLDPLRASTAAKSPEVKAKPKPSKAHVVKPATSGEVKKTVGSFGEN